MANALIAKGASFTFQPSGGQAGSAIVTELSVETPIAGIVNMTAMSDAAEKAMLVSTGERSGGSITVGFLWPDSNGTDPNDSVGSAGTLTFTTTGYSISRKVILESASTEVRIGDAIRGTLRFKTTDYLPS